MIQILHAFAFGLECWVNYVCLVCTEIVCWGLKEYLHKNGFGGEIVVFKDFKI